MTHFPKKLLLSAGLTLGFGLAHAAESDNATPLIERTKLFGNPSKTGGRISPDGQWISFIAPRDGVLNVWVAPAANPGDAKPLTDEKKRPIRQTYWSPDSRQVLFINDKGGDENFLLYGVNVGTEEQRTYTPFEKTRVEIVNISNQVKDRILIGVNNRDPKWHDLYSLNLTDGNLKQVLQNDGYASYTADEQLNPRIATKARPDGGSDFYRIVDGKGEEKPIGGVALEDSQTTAAAGFTTDGKTLYWIDSRGRNTAALIAQDVATGKTSVVAESARADINTPLLNPQTGRLEAYVEDYLKPEYVAIDPAVKDDLAFLKAANKGQFTITSRTESDDKWLVAFDPVTAPVATYVYDRKPKKISLLYVGRPELQGAPLVALNPIEIKARDGLTLVSYLTLPKNSDAHHAGRPDKPLPMVLFVHGGPWARDNFGYLTYHQWLANRGYAVLSVNYRGSTGFGKKFISAGDLQWGRKMHDDLLDAVAWAVKEKITSADKVAIMGGSYGGYATLAGLTFTPKTFACGVDIVGPSNLFTLLQTIPPYWEAGKQQFYKRMGDPTTDAGRALLKERSPLTYADKIERPLLIGQGANDPRVNVRESDQIVSAMSAKNIPVTYIVFPDEGHGFARPENNLAFNAVAENFLASVLGGRAEPIGDALKASTAQVKHGAEYVKGLAGTTSTASDGSH